MYNSRFIRGFMYSSIRSVYINDFNVDYILINEMFKLYSLEQIVPILNGIVARICRMVYGNENFTSFKLPTS